MQRRYRADCVIILNDQVAIVESIPQQRVFDKFIVSTIFPLARETPIAIAARRKSRLNGSCEKSGRPGRRGIAFHRLPWHRVRTRNDLAKRFASKGAKPPFVRTTARRCPNERQKLFWPPALSCFRF